MTKRKRFLRLLTVLCFLCVLACLCLIGCNGNDDASEPEKKEDYLSLNAYNVTLYLGDTFTLEPKLVKTDGSEQTVTDEQYASEAPNVASVADGVVTGVSGGETYVTVKSNGQTVACFVTVYDYTPDTEAVIRMKNACLYYGTTSTATVELYKEGEKIDASQTQTEWSVSDETKCTVDTNGVLTPLVDEGTVTLQATVSYGEETVSASLEVDITRMILVKANVNEITLATTTTLSGAQNDKYVSANVSVTAYDVLDKTTTELTTADYTLETINENIATVNAGENADGFTVQSVNAGDTIVKISYGKQLTVLSVNVETAISAIADFDVLALASYNEPTLLEKAYILTNDIDYDGKVFYPIALFREGSGVKSLPGIQWKYILNRQLNGQYTLTPRDQISATPTLTDSDFSALCINGGLNKSSKAFTGSIDGNGYSVKNAMIMIGSQIVYNADGSYQPTYSNIFGQFEGTLKNIAFENLSQQDVSALPFAFDQVVDYDDYSKYHENVLKRCNDSDGYDTRFSGLVGNGASGCTIENVYLDIHYTYNTSSEDGALMGWGGTYTRIVNCVVNVRQDYVTTGSASRGAFGGSAGAHAGMISNSVAFGVVKADRRWAAIKNGEQGCWWTSANDVKSLFSVTKGVAVEKSVSLESVIASFDETVWNTDGFNAADGVMPTLKKGCSTFAG